MEKAPILVTGAMEVEVDFLIKVLEKKKEKRISNYHFFEGFIEEYPVVIVKTGVGTIQAAAATSLAICTYQPVCIINQGIAGGTGEDIHKKDIIIGSECFHVLSAKTPYQEENEFSDSTKWEYVTFAEGEEDKKVLQKADEKLISFFEKVGEEYQEGKVHIGVIGSGDIWNREKRRTIYFNKVHQVLCGDMEAIAIYTIANQCKIPVVAVKLISDNELIGEEYDRTLGNKCQKFVYDSVKKLIENRIIESK